MLLLATENTTTVKVCDATKAKFIDKSRVQKKNYTLKYFTAKIKYCQFAN